MSQNSGNAGVENFHIFIFFLFLKVNCILRSRLLPIIKLPFISFISPQTEPCLFSNSGFCVFFTLLLTSFSAFRKLYKRARANKFQLLKLNRFEVFKPDKMTTNRSTVTVDPAAGQCLSLDWPA